MSESTYLQMCKDHRKKNNLPINVVKKNKKGIDCETQCSAEKDCPVKPYAKEGE